MIRFISRSLLLPLTVLLLASCGGEEPITLPGVSGYSLTMQTLDNTTGLTSTTTSAAAPIRVQVTLLDPAAAAVIGATVQFTATVGTLSGATAQTDGAGVASVILTAGAGGVAVGTVTARFLDPTSSVASASSAVSTLGDATTGTGGGTPTPTNVLQLILSARDGGGAVISSSNPITNLNPGRLIATLTLDSVPIETAVITYTAPAIAALSQTTQATGATGVAEVAITPRSSGAGTATATTSYNGQTVSSSVVIVTSITATQPVVLKLGNGTGAGFVNSALASSAAGPITAGSTITISADVVVDTVDNNPYTTPVNITFSSVCKTAGTATLDAQDTTVGGHAEVTYSATGGCSSDTITATLVNGSSTLTATTTISIDPVDVGQIAFISATPEVIALQGTGGTGRLTRSEVKFKVLGVDGTPIRNQLVCFALSTSVGGLSLGAPPEALSNAAGEVIATVQAGSVPTSVRVNATVDSDNDSNCATVPVPAKSAVSDALVVSTGLPDQDSFSLSIETFNPNAYNIDGVEVNVTVRSADHFNNPVPDGTAISFWSELGSIQPSCTTTDGACSVKWRSQSPRNNADQRDAGVNGLATRDRKGRSAIVAYAVGEESFVDRNGNGRFDAGEPYTDLTEVIKDSNLNGIRDTPGEVPTLFADEEFVDFDRDATFDGVNTRFDGVLCAVIDPLVCSGDATVNVRDTGVIVMSSNTLRYYIVQNNVDLSFMDYTLSGMITDMAYPSFDTNFSHGGADGLQITSICMKTSCTAGNRSFAVLVTDINGNAPPVGTTISASLSKSQAGTIIGTSSFTVGNTTDFYATTFTIEPPAGSVVREDASLLIKFSAPATAEISIAVPVVAADASVWPPP